ncbi:AraC family transcriptional regulator [Rhodospirillaceae bacterium KN72]|uniref:AraC family transcriptional regulator n=1 Tax=Pacificispira spongiicola TaxID=2729598 RepID=A0A7Y0HHC7_9PROT|nr:AraC family transcriptional regulator [Pacificispira spongiicola]NMM45772.1 AraC family transcriptional regulator [Pacificispira spongiicola]
MDPLSDILSLLKPRSYITAGFDAGAPWSLALDDLAGRIKCYAVISGACWLSVDGDDHPLRLSAGDCFILPSGRLVTIASDLDTPPKRVSDVLAPNNNGQVVTYNGGGDVFLAGSRFEVNGRHAEALLRTLPPIIRVKATKDQAKLRGAIELMMEELREAKPGSSLVAQHLSHMMLVHALRIYLSEGSHNDVGWFAALTDPQMSGAIAAIHSNPSFPWTLRELAQEAGMSRSSFAQRFRETVGEAPIGYLTRWRMMLAAERLIQSRETITRIALSVGYTSEHAFNTAFKRTMGCSPRRYARECTSDRNSESNFQ